MGLDPKEGLTAGQLKIVFEKANGEVMGPRVAIAVEAAEEVSRGGIILAKEAQKTKKEGVVIAIGFPVLDEQVPYFERIKVGDRLGIVPLGIVEMVQPVPGFKKPVAIAVLHVNESYMKWPGDLNTWVIRPGESNE